jgi:hypothetical protein
MGTNANAFNPVHNLSYENLLLANNAANNADDDGAIMLIMLCVVIMCCCCSLCPSLLTALGGAYWYLFERDPDAPADVSLFQQFKDYMTNLFNGDSTAATTN